MGLPRPLLNGCGSRLSLSGQDEGDGARRRAHRAKLRFTCSVVVCPIGDTQSMPPRLPANSMRSPSARLIKEISRNAARQLAANRANTKGMTQFEKGLVELSRQIHKNRSDAAQPLQDAPDPSRYKLLAEAPFPEGVSVYKTQVDRTAYAHPPTRNYLSSPTAMQIHDTGARLVLVVKDAAGKSYEHGKEVRFTTASRSRSLPETLDRLLQSAKTTYRTGTSSTAAMDPSTGANKINAHLSDFNSALAEVSRELNALPEDLRGDALAALSQPFQLRPTVEFTNSYNYDRVPVTALRIMPSSDGLRLSGQAYDNMRFDIGFPGSGSTRQGRFEPAAPRVAHFAPENDPVAVEGLLTNVLLNVANTLKSMR